MDFIVDTSSVISFLHGKEPTAGALGQAMRIHEMKLTSTVVFELLVGTEPNTKRRRDLEELFTLIEVLPLDTSGVRRAAEAEHELRALGLQIGVPDLLIAGVALHRRVPLFTDNVRHFQRIRDLTVWDADSWR